MEAQTQIAVKEGRNFVQVRIKREPEPFFLAIDEGRSTPQAIVGVVVDQRGECLKPVETVMRDQIVAVTRAIMDEGLFPRLIPVKPIKPASARR